MTVWTKEGMLMNVTCAYCGTVALKRTMYMSRHTGRAWCIDEDACRRRVAWMARKLKREERNERERATTGSA